MTILPTSSATKRPETLGFKRFRDYFALFLFPCISRAGLSGEDRRCAGLPQGFAGIVQRAGDFKGLNVLADIGNGTMNTMYLKDGKPLISRCYTDKLGVEQCIIRMSNELLAVSGFDMPYDVYEDFLRRGSADLPEKYTAVMQKAAEEYSATILAKLREYEYNPEIMRLTVMGGGACILKHFWDGNNNRVQYIDDICATAKGYCKHYRYRTVKNPFLIQDPPAFSPSLRLIFLLFFAIRKYIVKPKIVHPRFFLHLTEIDQSSYDRK